MSYFSSFWGVEVRDEIVAEFTRADGSVDDDLAGLHEIRAQMREEEEKLSPAERKQKQKEWAEKLAGEGWKLVTGYAPITLQEGKA